MKFYLFAAIASAVLTSTSCCDVVSLNFPSGFRLGTASSSYQVEGAWNVSDKGENVCDWWVHNKPEHVANEDDGDVACNSYYKYKEDVQLIKSLGFDFYRFSVSWSRVLPTGFTNVISEDGLQYYKNLTAELLANGIEPIVTIYHFDHPQIIEDMGGWTNELIVDWFVDYARVLFDALGDNVKRWLTINEPEVRCFYGYEGTLLAPGKVITGIAGYLCGHNMLKAHAKTYHMYNEEFREAQQGYISIVSALTAYIAANSSYTEVAETAFQFNAGWMAHPIYHGDYPEVMKTRVALVSAAQGYPRSRLPVFSDEWISIINGTVDFYSFNHYSSKLVASDPDEELGIYNSDNGTILSFDPSWTLGDSPGANPGGISYLLRKIRDEYGNPPVWIMENGFSDSGELEDYNRITYYYGYLRELLIATKRDGCNVEGYALWSILDNFEWYAGYTSKFGIINVDFDDPGRTRYVKLSAMWWAGVVASRKLQPVPTNTKSRARLPWSR